MPLSKATVKKQLFKLRPIFENLSLESARKWQDRIGEFVSFTQRKKVNVLKEKFDSFEGAWIIRRRLCGRNT